MTCVWCGVEIVQIDGEIVFNQDHYDAWAAREDGGFFCVAPHLRLHKPHPLTTRSILADLESMEIDLR